MDSNLKSMNVRRVPITMIISDIGKTKSLRKITTQAVIVRMIEKLVDWWLSPHLHPPFHHSHIMTGNQNRFSGFAA